MASLKEIADKALALEPEERMDFMLKLEDNTRGKVMEEIKKRKGKKTDEESKTEKPAETEDEMFARMMKARGVKSADPVSGLKPDWESVTTSEVDDVFSDLDSETSVSSFDSSGVEGFDYIGFNPKIVMQALIAAGKLKGRSKDEMVKDMGVMAGIAHKKGSITTTNYSKLRPEGKAVYDNLAGIYGLKMGGSKGMGPEVITIGRIGPTMPARILQMLILGKVQARKYPGACKSSTLPDVLCSQALAPCIPTGLSSVARDYILQICEAYSIDQSCQIAKGKKPKPEDIWQEQKQFVYTSYSSNYPSEDTRIRVFKMLQWSLNLPKTKTSVTAYKKINTDVEEGDMKVIQDSISKL